MGGLPGLRRGSSRRKEGAVLSRRGVIVLKASSAAIVRHSTRVVIGRRAIRTPSRGAISRVVIVRRSTRVVIGRRPIVRREVIGRRSSSGAIDRQVSPSHAAIALRRVSPTSAVVRKWSSGAGLQRGATRAPTAGLGRVGLAAVARRAASKPLKGSHGQGEELTQLAASSPLGRLQTKANRAG